MVVVSALNCHRRLCYAIERERERRRDITREGDGGDDRTGFFGRLFLPSLAVYFGKDLILTSNLGYQVILGRNFPQEI